MIKKSRVVTAVLFVILFLEPFAFSEDSKPNDNTENVLSNSRLSVIETRIGRILEKQKSIAGKQQQIKSELQNLKVWINRRR